MDALCEKQVFSLRVRCSGEEIKKSRKPANPKKKKTKKKKRFIPTTFPLHSVFSNIKKNKT